MNTLVKIFLILQSFIYGQLIVCKDFGIDNINNLYIWNDFNLLKYKIADTLIFQYQFNTTNFGKIYSVDFSNPFSVLIFSKEFNNIILINEKGSLIQKIDLQTLNINANKVCYSNSTNSIWIYEQINNTIYLISKNGSTIKCKRQLFINFTIDTITEKNNILFLIGKNKIATMTPNCQINIINLPFYAKFINLEKDILYYFNRQDKLLYLFDYQTKNVKEKKLNVNKKFKIYNFQIIQIQIQPKIKILKKPSK